MSLNVGEICAAYRDAKHKAQQIGILADLYCVSKDEIKKILEENGYELPYKAQRERFMVTKAEKSEPYEPEEIFEAEPKVKAPAAVLDLVRAEVSRLEQQIRELYLKLDELKQFLGEET